MVPTLRGLAPDVVLLPINGSDFMRESAVWPGNMNEDEAARLCEKIRPAMSHQCTTKASTTTAVTSDASSGNWGRHSDRPARPITLTIHQHVLMILYQNMTFISYQILTLGISEDVWPRRLIVGHREEVGGGAYVAITY